MKHFPMLGSLAMILLTTHTLWGAGNSRNFRAEIPEFLLFSAQGYLGVDFGEIDADHVSSLRLKDTHGAEVIMVDHDAPASKSGLRVHDVILQLDGQPFDTVDQLRRRLREMPSGRSISLLVSRDGNPINVTVQLCDRAVLQEEAWDKHYSVPPTKPVSSAGGESFLGRTKGVGPAFLKTVIPSGLYVGADVNPVRTQLADYFGVSSGTGLLVENVDGQSPAAKAGMKAGDVIVRVESQQMRTRNDWVKAIRKHRGKLVQVTVMRSKQEQTLTMSAGKLKKN
jgi:S1-C subfamily serine protease